MLSNALDIFTALMVPGRYILPRTGHNGKPGYCIYDGKQNPVRTIKPSEYKQIKNFLKEKNGILTLNLKEIRSLHGNCSFKKQYKAIRQNLQFRKQNSNNQK